MTIENELSHRVLCAAIEVHRTLGPGLLESTYEQCLCRELQIQGLSYERQVELPVKYKGTEIDCGYRVDVVVDGRLILELKSVDKFRPVHQAQLLTYLKLAKIKLGLLLNFNVPLMKDGIKRVVNNL